jgi:hypothetical protein
MDVQSVNYRKYVGPEHLYDVVGAQQFSLLVEYGLREHHRLLDIGCGSLRAGRLLIPYLDRSHYYGIEPNTWLIEAAISQEVGADQINIKRPVFDSNADFTLSIFSRTFDYLMAQSIFSHASMRQINTCLEEACKVMHHQSYFFATFFESSTNYDGDAWVYPGAVGYNYHNLSNMALQNGLKMRRLPRWKHPNGQSWIMIRRK